MTLKTLRNFFFVGIVLILNACSQAGWVGYYKMSSPAIYYDSNIFLYSNSAKVKISDINEIGLNLPKGCSGFKFAGIGTPLTPPIPLPNFRSLNFASFREEANPCDFFTVNSKNKAIIQLKTDNKIYDSKVMTGIGFYKYTFPIRAKNLDSGIIILEKDGQEVEVPFEYKYFKFWY